MPLQVGDHLPDVTLTVVGERAQSVSSVEFFRDRRIVVFCVPGAFTPTCSERHLPGYVEHFAQFRAHGVDVACLAVNDTFVLRAWAKAQQVPGDLIMLADGNADFVRAIDLAMDATSYGMGVRGKRFALYADHGVVKHLAVEAPGELRVSNAEAMLTIL